MSESRSFEPWDFAVKLSIVLLFLLAGALVYLLRQLLLLTFVSLLIGLFWSALASGFGRLLPARSPHAVNLGLAIFTSFGLFALFGYFLYEPLNNQFGGFVSDLPHIVENAWGRLQPILRRVGLGDFDPGSIDVGQFGGNVLASSFKIIGTGVSSIAGIVAVFFLAVFWAIDPARYRRGFVSMLPERRQEWANRVVQQVAKTLYQWMKATGMAMLTIALLVTVLLWAIGIPYALLFGLAAGLFDLIPFVGPILAFIGPIIIALSISPVTALWVTGGYVLVQAIEGNLVVPYYMSREAELPPALTIFMIFAMAELFGFIGVVLAAPTLAVLLVLVRAAYGFPKTINEPIGKD